MPVHVKSKNWISRRVFGRVHPEVFFAAQSFQGQEGVRQHHQGHVMVPAAPTPSFVMIQAQFFLQLVVVLFDLPPALGDAHQAAQRVARRQIAEEVLDRFLLRFRPLHQ